MSDPRSGHVRVSHTPTSRFPWGAIKGPPRLSSPVDHFIHLKYTLRHSLQLKISLSQASLQSRLPRRDLSHPLSDPLDLQLKHIIDELHVFITLGDSSPRRTRSCPGVTKVVVDLRKFVLPSLHGDLIVETELDLGDHSARI
jgi:hypothetical protein